MFAGTSASVAVAVKVIGTATVPALFPIGVRAGATFTSLTATVKAAVPLSAGDPSSIARIVIG